MNRMKYGDKKRKEPNNHCSALSCLKNLKYEKT
jgi:hypothetical protein